MQDRLAVVFNYHDEWPARIAEFIADLAEWYTAHPSLAELEPVDIASHLADVLDAELLIHE